MGVVVVLLCCCVVVLLCCVLWCVVCCVLLCVVVCCCVLLCVVVCHVVLWCGVVWWGVFVCRATSHNQGCVHSPFSFCSFILAKHGWGEELAHHVFGATAFAGHDAPRPVLSDARHGGRYGPDGRKNLALQPNNELRVAPEEHPVYTFYNELS